MDFQQSQTYQNLQTVLSDLFETYSLLNVFETTAYEEVLIPISFLFNTSARNVKYITDALYSILYGEPTTLQNLEFIRSNESEALSKLRDYSIIASEEGFEAIASNLNGIANIMLGHISAYDRAISDIVNGELYCQPTETFWVCLGCGNVIVDECAPEICPVCFVSGGYYQKIET